MNAIHFCAQNEDTVREGIEHLRNHKELYWSVGWKINVDRFPKPVFPMYGFITIAGTGYVKYKATIEEITPHFPGHYNDLRLKPEIWREKWGGKKRENALIISKIENFQKKTDEFINYEKRKPIRPRSNYDWVQLPEEYELNDPSLSKQEFPVQQMQSNVKKPLKIAEANLEEIIIHHLDEIESGLRLEKRQLSTTAGRLDLLCKDSDDEYVVVEIKGGRGTDQVIGQILRYMGWVQQNYRTNNVRGIIIVLKKDQSLSYAVKAVRNVQVKEFSISIK